MIIPQHKKKAVTVILSRMKPDGSEDMTSVKDEAGHEDMPYKDIAESFLSAIEGKSVADLSMAIQALADQLKAEDMEQDAAEESEE